MQRTALISIGNGSNGGLGKAIAIALQSAGYRVALVNSGAIDAAQEFTAATSIPVFQWDLTDADACRTGMGQVEQRLGPIDILVNDAGAAERPDMPDQNGTSGSRPQFIDASVGIMLNMSGNVIDGMHARRFGRIVNILSCAALEPRSHGAARADLCALTTSLALTAAHANVTVNAIAAGYCNTETAETAETGPAAHATAKMQQAIIDSIPVGRLGTPQDISRMVAFLIDDAAGFITGACFDVDGGQYLDPAKRSSQRGAAHLQESGQSAAATESGWSPFLALGVTTIDAAHQDFLEQLARLQKASDGAFETEFFALIASIEADFREEELLMEECDFPGIGLHREQHARVLSALHHVEPEVMQGDLTQAKRVIELMPQWFQFHLMTMDAAMVATLDLASDQVAISP
jgi:acetoacetyl-CoA reductase